MVPETDRKSVLKMDRIGSNSDDSVWCLERTERPVCLFRSHLVGRVIARARKQLFLRKLCAVQVKLNTAVVAGTRMRRFSSGQSGRKKMEPPVTIRCPTATNLCAANEKSANDLFSVSTCRVVC
jgi:hypothetical protein